MPGQVIEARGNHAQRSLNKLSGPSSKDTVTCHIIHFAVAPRVEPCDQSRFLGRKLGVGDTGIREPKLASPAADLVSEAFEFGRSELGRRHRCPVGGKRGRGERA